MQDSISKTAIARSFGHAAESYDSSAHFQQRVGARLLDYLPVTRGNIVDLGCGTGFFLPQIRYRNPHATLIAADLSEEMIRYGQQHHGKDADFWCVGDADQLPLASNSINVIFSSLALQWCFHLDSLFRELNRVLAPGGCCVFSTLLDGTLFELKKSWQKVDKKQHVNEFFTALDYRSAIERNGLLIESFIDESDVQQYKELKFLTRELKGIGAHNLTDKRPRNLTGKSRLLKLIDAYERFRNSEGLLPATYRVAYIVIKRPEN